MDLSGKVAVITGGASGLGKRTAEYFAADKGAKVAVFDVDDQAGEALEQALGSDSLAYFHVDVSDESQVIEAVAGTVARFGAIHVCVNCAAVPGPMAILDRQSNATNCARFARTVAINLVGTFNVMAHAVARMALNPCNEDYERGVVINVASGAAFEGQAGQSAYASSKAGLVGMSLPAARELAARGIRVNAIAPGLFDTPMVRSLRVEALEALKAEIQFPKRPGDQREFATLCAHICENAYLNGACIRLDAATRLPAS